MKNKMQNKKLFVMVTVLLMLLCILAVKEVVHKNINIRKSNHIMNINEKYDENVDYCKLYNEITEGLKTVVPEEMPQTDSYIYTYIIQNNLKFIDPLQTVSERNKRMLNKVSDYGNEFTKEYISTNKDINFRYFILYELKLLSDLICCDAKNDYDKIVMIRNYVAENIYYDNDAAHNSVDISVVSLENVMNGNKTTCAGYSDFFSGLCSMQGIYCINLRGGTAGENYSADELDKTPTNHEWNAAVIDGKWIFIDTTWASSNTFETGTYSYKNPNNMYNEMTYDFMCYEHRIDRADFRNFNCCME